MQSPEAPGEWPSYTHPPAWSRRAWGGLGDRQAWKRGVTPHGVVSSGDWWEQWLSQVPLGLLVMRRCIISSLDLSLLSDRNHIDPTSLAFLFFSVKSGK